MSETDSSSVSDVVAVEPAPSPDDHQPTRQRAQGTAALVLALIALCLSLGFAATAFFLWNQLEQVAGQQGGIGTQIDERMQPLRSSMEQLGKSVESANETAGRRFESVEQHAGVLADEQESLEQRIGVLGALIGRSDEGWILAEVEYLLGIANKQLQLLRDVKTAEVALQSADARLRELADPHYLLVREQIEKDLDTLKSVPVVDIDGISIVLGAWMERVDTLPVAGTRYQPVTDLGSVDADGQTTATDWKQVPVLVWNLLKEHFRFREHDEPVKPMLAPEREYFLRENLRLQLSAARLALLRNDDVQYQAALNTSRKWIAGYFALDDASTSELHAKLGELLEVEVRPELPNISGSLRLLRQQMKLAVPAQSDQSSQLTSAKSGKPEAVVERESEVAGP